jgi:ferredoxin
MPSPEIFEVRLLQPNTPAQQINIRSDQHIWDAAFAAGITLPALCHQGRCLTCAARLEQGTVDQSDSVNYYPEDREAGFILPCTGKPTSNLTIRTHQAAAMRAHRKQKNLPAPYS